MVPRPSSGSKFDMRVNPCYQVDFQSVGTGKTIAATKRRVRWRFGFSNREAITQGGVGIACRGEEHEVTLVWSLTSGKRQVFADGNEVHFSYGKRTETSFETSWTMQGGGHILKLIAYASPPLFLTPGFRQFDLLLDGCSYFDMPKIYELGIRSGNTSALATVERNQHHPEPYNNYSVSSHPHAVSPTNSDDGGYHRRRSLPEREPSVEETTPRRREESDPVDILADSLSADLLDVSVPALADTPHVTTVTDEFLPLEGSAPATMHQPSFQSVSNQILSQYAPSAPSAPPSQAAPTVLALANESHTHYVPQQQPLYSNYQYQQPAAYQQPPQQQQSYYQPAQQPQQSYYQPAPQQSYQPQPPHYQTQATPISPDGSVRSIYMDEENAALPTCDGPAPLTLTMQPLSLEEMEERSRPPMSEMEKAMTSLVNLDDISEKVVTPEQRKLQEKKKQNQPVRSKPSPPKAPEWHLGTHAKLGDIQKHCPAKAPPAKEIMRTHAFDASAVHAGMMVVYGTSPSIPDTPGFGAGLQHAYQQQMYAQQQQRIYLQQQQQMYAQQQQPSYAAY